MNSDDKVQSRIEELISELSDCREDERNGQNQILEVISVVGTVLGILFGVSYLNSESKNIPLIIFQSVNTEELTYIDKLCNILNQNITYARVMFWLGLLIFSTAFTYIIVLGINNILRYYYIQALEDRLHELISSAPDDNDRGFLLHWNAFSAPIITKNPKHITSTHTALNYICYTIAVVCAVLFSMGMIISLFLQIKPRRWFDTLILGIILFSMILTVYLFLRLTSHAAEVAQFAWDTAHDNQKIRLKGEMGEPYKKGRSFRKILSYLIYPKKQDFQKPFLIIIGFLYGMVFAGAKPDFTYCYRLLLVLFIFDFLAYQARYQINDIRGLKEDQEAGCKNRLLTDDINNPEHVIKISFLAALVKISASFVAAVFFCGEIKTMMLISLGILAASTIVYEIARDKKITGLIFISVGIGYPLRFFVGFFSVMLKGELLLNPQIICFIFALGAYGSFSSILSWTNQVSERMQNIKGSTGSFPLTYEKKHFKDIQEMIADRFVLAEGNPINGKIMPLREKCKISDPWNMAFLVSLGFLFFTAYFGKISGNLLWLECGACIAFALNGCLYRKNKLFFIGIGWICIAAKAVIAVLSLEKYLWYLLFSVMQGIITVTYFVLCYQPQFKKIDIKKVFSELKHGIMIKILGDYAVNIMENRKKK